MTLGNIMSQLGAGTRNIERHTEYAAPEHIFYSYEPPAHVAKSKHHSHGHGGKKQHAAMSALTLLAFLFFLHILQQCIREHMQAMQTPQIVVISATRREDDAVQSIDRADADADADGGAGSTMTEVHTTQHRPQHRPQAGGAGGARWERGNRSEPGFVTAAGRW